MADIIVNGLQLTAEGQVSQARVPVEEFGPRGYFLRYITEYKVTVESVCICREDFDLWLTPKGIESLGLEALEDAILDAVGSFSEPAIIF